ncbi:MAG: ornithine cyclodeaminase family protein [Alphaproteobacteria bacterium]|nr:ornithine cyclodeaminase family protein [Alphaproteobacteria bacterium]
MTLILSNDDVEAVLTMDACIGALEDGYRELAAGAGISRVRSDCLTPTSHPDAIYGLKSMDGVVPSLGVGAVRINSDIITWPKTGSHRRRVKVPAAPGARYVGLILLFSTATGEPLAILPDGVVQRMRVGATNGLGIKYMARKDARTVAILGSGWQAGAQLMAAASVRDIAEIRCFSPNPDHRRAFAREMSETLGIPVSAMDSPEAALQGADIALCATNANSAIFGPEWVAPGLHMSAIKHVEIDAAAVALADRVATHIKDSTPLHNVIEGMGGMEALPSRYTPKGWADIAHLDFSALPQLTDLVTGRVVGREGTEEVTCFINNFGLGYQFAVVGALAYEKAGAAGLGRDLPTDWFTETVHP